jgi:hypothetical protein
LRAHGYGREALIEVGRQHWKAYLPEKYKALKESGELEKELRAAAQLTVDEMKSLQAQNAMSVYEAWEVAREHYLLLKEEPDYRNAPNPAYDAMVAPIAGMRRIDEESD